MNHIPIISFYRWGTKARQVNCHGLQNELMKKLYFCSYSLSQYFLLYQRCSPARVSPNECMRNCSLWNQSDRLFSLDSCNSVVQFFFFFCFGSHKSVLEKFWIESIKEAIVVSLPELNRAVQNSTLWTSVIYSGARSSADSIVQGTHILHTWNHLFIQPLTLCQQAAVFSTLFIYSSSLI